MSIRVHDSGRLGPCAEQAVVSDLDHLHTRTPVLAGVASKVADGAASGGMPRRRRRVPVVFGRAGVAAVALLAAALSGFTLAGPAGAASPAANAVTALGGAPDLGPNPGLSLAAPLLGGAATASGNGYWLVSGDGGVFTYGDARFFGSTGNVPLVSPIVGIASTPSGNGYWLVAGDGGVFTFGDARYFGSTGGIALVAPVIGMTPTPSGRGYWLATADGGVFAFGDARFFGSTAQLGLASPVVGVAATASGKGYWLASADGGVFAFGDARFAGSSAGKAPADAVGIAAAKGGGYWVAFENGVVHAFGTRPLGDVGSVEPVAAFVPSVGIVGSPRNGYWVVQGEAPRPRVDPNHPFLVCTRAHESDSAGGYRAVNPSGTYRGAYQFSRSTWDSTARHAGRPDLVGGDPAAADPADQDFLALHLYEWQGAAPWLGRCAGL